jgi:hypothetical protein
VQLSFFGCGKTKRLKFFIGRKDNVLFWVIPVLPPNLNFYRKATNYFANF